MKIALITNFNIYDKANAAMRVAEELLAIGGVEVLFQSVNKDRIFRMHKSHREYSYVSPDEIYAAADVIIVLGGDGTILDAARRAAPLDKPLLGINMGHLGYMTELEMGEISLLSRLVAGDYEIDVRSMLAVSVVTERGVRNETFALNDIVISNGSISRVIDLEMYEAGALVSAYRADGIIVSTPTGSTAYSMSAGGPIIDPKLASLCVTPICPHSLTTRPMLFRDDAVLEIKNVCQREKMLFLTVDGRQNIEVYRGDVVRVTRSPITTRLIRLQPSGFYTRLHQKMN